MWPRIVAEALRRLPAGQSPTQCVQQGASLDHAIASIDHDKAPGRSAASPPAFLFEQQHDAWRRILHALHAWGGALLAERVGVGKTWVALGVAATERVETVAIVPAILLNQWRAAANRSGVQVTFWTHEQVSRGRVPPGSPGLVIIDEAHRFRNMNTRRTQTIAPWLAGRKTLLLTATPIVNRVDDLVTLLHLVVQENALHLDGLAKLSELSGCESPPAALCRIAIRSASTRVPSFHRRAVVLTPDPAECRRVERAIVGINRLTLSPQDGTRRLLRSVFLDAAASSDAAFHHALKRYRAMLLHSLDAGGISRSMLRQFAGEALEQTTMWSLLEPSRDGDLVTSDIEILDALLNEPRKDIAWIEALRAVITDDRPTICFARHRETANLLRRTLGDSVAWVTGTAAGIGPHAMLRSTVLDAFGPTRSAWRARLRAPKVLVATDVAAEGLDLQSTGRIVHVDLPWTAMRIDQREGRLLRHGQQHTSVEIFLRAPTPAMEAAIRAEQRIRRKRTVADRWLEEMERDDQIPHLAGAQPAIVSLRDQFPPTTLIAIRLESGRRRGIIVLTRSASGDWTSDSTHIASFMTRARKASTGTHDSNFMSAMIASGLRSGAQLAATANGHGSRALVDRIHRRALVAARQRDGDSLNRLDLLLRFAIASQPLGGRAIAARLIEASDREFLTIAVPQHDHHCPALVSVVAVIHIANA